MKVAREKGIRVLAVKGGWSLNGSTESKIVLTMFAMIAEIERDPIIERTKGALWAQKAAGVRLVNVKKGEIAPFRSVRKWEQVKVMDDKGKEKVIDLKHYGVMTRGSVGLKAVKFV